MNRRQKAQQFTEMGWDIQITGRNILVTDSMKDYAMEKVSKIERFMNRIIDINIIMDIERENHQVEIIAKVGRLLIRSKASTTDMYASIDKAVNKLEAQLLHYKSRLQDHHPRVQTIGSMNVRVFQAPEEEEFELEGELDQPKGEIFKPHTVVSQEHLPLITLTQNDAIMKMEFSGHSFMIFKDIADQKLKVIYRREDDNYGIIEPAC